MINKLNFDDEYLKKLEQNICYNKILNMADTLDVLAGKWKIPIIVCLSFKPKRFSEISKELKTITDRTLSKELKYLEENLLISRNIIDEYPLSIEYEITEHGLSLTRILMVLREWGELHREKILEHHREDSQSVHKI
ncbi:transcriptional regulator, HxlR family [Chryseobacterium wanjuense]|uniref:Transcriptional regulator, HxlR family n=1 Tax=Chryseobacterium wanjuense TaxID=356305 RepID=A0A1I0RVW9_9FLAO|nr:helix-turn-helix domain-containing protein [Chryseobacterium wanjuense]SEW45494.1 transcriptional regulator, HxlR family [Chryseobacterium wanjuense]